MNEGRLLAELGRPKILVIGDLILDYYIHGRVGRISPEAPIPVFEGREREYRLGGAGNVAMNLKALGADVTLCGILGRDQEGEMFVELLEERGIDYEEGLLFLDERPTTCKTRFISRDQQLLRWDEEEKTPLSDNDAGLMEGFISSVEGTFDAVVLSDYAKGVLTNRIIDHVVDSCKGSRIPVIADPKGRDLSKYKGITLMTPNQVEAEFSTGIDLSTRDNLEDAGNMLLKDLQMEAIVITLGKDGIYFKEKRGDTGVLPARARSVYDVTGAGDTVISVLALCLAGRLELETSLRLCNAAAGIVVGRLGAVAVTRNEILHKLRWEGSGSKVVEDREDLSYLLSGLESRGVRVVFTNGCFDVLHAGHVQYLQAARREGDLLIVGVNDDDSVRRLKGNTRPVNPLKDRMTVLGALEMVDYVVSFSQDTPEEIIKEITPDVLVKGEDWRDKGVVGREWVEEHGGTVVLVPLLEGRSTTGILGKMNAKGDE